VSLLSMLTQTCTISRSANTRNSTYGTLDRTQSAVASGVSCAIQAGRDSEAMEFGRRTGRVVYRGYFPVGTDLRLEDQVYSIGGTGAAFTGVSLEVVSPLNDMAGRGNHVTCLLANTV